MTHAAELFRLDGKVAVVTGGSHGLGLHAAEGFAEMGASVVICARDADRLAEARQRLEAGQHRCLAIPCDVSREEDVLALAARVENELGRCDVLLNSAGISGITPTENVTTEVWDQMMATNLRGDH